MSISADIDSFVAKKDVNAGTSVTTLLDDPSSVQRPLMTGTSTLLSSSLPSAHFAAFAFCFGSAAAAVRRLGCARVAQVGNRRNCARQRRRRVSPGLCACWRVPQVCLICTEVSRNLCLLEIFFLSVCLLFWFCFLFQF